MNLLTSIYCNQYLELKKQGKEASARYMGTILTTFALVLVLFAIYILGVTFFPDVEKEVNRFVRKTIGRTSGRMFGKILAVVLMVVSYLSIRFTLGTQKGYQKIVDTFEQLPVSRQEQLSKKGFKTFIAAIVLIGVALLALLLKTYI